METEDGHAREGLHPWEGHKQSTNFDRLKSYFQECKSIGVKYLSFWALSTENFTSRDEKELKMLFKMLEKGMKDFRQEFLKEKVRFRHFGRRDRLSPKIIKLIEDLEEDTKDF